MVTTTAYQTDARYRTTPGEGYDGVVRVSYAGFFGTGALLWDGRAVLTAAHLFEGRSSTASIFFETADGTQSIVGAKVLIHPDHDADGNNDLAIVWLERPAPSKADRYQIYRATDELTKTFTMIGYGKTGLGDSGAETSASDTAVRLKAFNQFDAEIEVLKNTLGDGMAWSPLTGSQLVADFDSGLNANDALGRLISRTDLGLGTLEGLIAPGDSGGPAILENKIGGVASYITSLSRGRIDPDIDSLVNSSFGEIAAWQRLSFYQMWIDQSLRSEYQNAPTKPAEVTKRVAEGNDGIQHAYFLVQFTGTRSKNDEILSVDYATRDGTAKAGSDYLASSGTLRLYPGENQALIPIEVIGDTQPESNEVFYLDITNPVGGSFGDGIVKLTASKTILDDDLWAT